MVSLFDCLVSVFALHPVLIDVLIDQPGQQFALALQQRMTEILAELDDTVAVDATIGRSLSYEVTRRAGLAR